MKNINMKTKQLLLIAFILLGLAGFGQNVTDIKPKQIGDKIEVAYSITGAKFYQVFNVFLYVSRDKGQTYEGPLKEVTGDVGKGISDGRHSITWEAMKEMPFSNEELIFDVRVQPIDKPIKKQFFIQYVGNLTTPAGLRFGTLGKTGFFIEGRVSPSFNLQSSYTYTGDMIDNFNKPGYYQFSGKTAKPAMSALGGITFQPAWNTFIYAGAGYGTQKVMAEVDEFEYSTDKKTTTNWAENTASNHSGIELEAGVIFRFGHMVVSGGATALNFEVFNFTAGIGMAF
jgi:hypothetical protein